MHFKLSLFKTELIIFPSILFLPSTFVLVHGTTFNLLAQAKTVVIFLASSLLFTPSHPIHYQVVLFLPPKCILNPSTALYFYCCHPNPGYHCHFSWIATVPNLIYLLLMPSVILCKLPESKSVHTTLLRIMLWWLSIGFNSNLSSYLSLAFAYLYTHLKTSLSHSRSPRTIKTSFSVPQICQPHLCFNAFVLSVPSHWCILSPAHSTTGFFIQLT